MGFPIERSKTGWEIAGIDRATIDKFSLRTNHINQVAERWNVTDPAAKSRLGATTREFKQPALTVPELRRQWRQRLDGDEYAAIRQAVPRRKPELAVWEEERRGEIFHRQQQATQHQAMASGYGYG